MSRADFETTYERHFEAVFRYVACWVPRRDVAEDVTADAFLRLLEAGERVDSRRLPAWLIAVAKNLIVDYWRSVAREDRLDSIPEPRVEPTEGDWASLLVANLELKPGHRACLILRYVHGMDRTEIAKHTGLNDNQVKSCLQYGLQVLRKNMVGETRTSGRTNPPQFAGGRYPAKTAQISSRGHAAFDGLVLSPLAAAAGKSARSACRATGAVIRAAHRRRNGDHPRQGYRASSLPPSLRPALENKFKTASSAEPSCSVYGERT